MKSWWLVKSPESRENILVIQKICNSGQIFFFLLLSPNKVQLREMPGVPRKEPHPPPPPSRAECLRITESRRQCLSATLSSQARQDRDFPNRTQSHRILFFLQSASQTTGFYGISRQPFSMSKVKRGQGWYNVCFSRITTCPLISLSTLSLHLRAFLDCELSEGRPMSQ